MFNPFEQINEAFASRYRVNLSIERLDGSIMLTLSTDQGVVAKRLIKPVQRNDPKRLQRVIDSVQSGIAVEHTPPVLAHVASRRQAGKVICLPRSPCH